MGRKQLKKVTAQSEMILNNNSPNLALVPEKQKWYNNREPIGLAQHWRIESLGSEYEKERAFNMVQNQQLICELDLNKDVCLVFDKGLQKL